MAPDPRVHTEHMPPFCALRWSGKRTYHYLIGEQWGALPAEYSRRTPMDAACGNDNIPRACRSCRMIWGVLIYSFGFKKTEDLSVFDFAMVDFACSLLIDPRSMH